MKPLTWKENPDGSATAVRDKVEYRVAPPPEVHDWRTSLLINYTLFVDGERIFSATGPGRMAECRRVAELMAQGGPTAFSIARKRADKDVRVLMDAYAAKAEMGGLKYVTRLPVVPPPPDDLEEYAAVASAGVIPVPSDTAYKAYLFIKYLPEWTAAMRRKEEEDRNKAKQAELAKQVAAVPKEAYAGPPPKERSMKLERVVAASLTSAGPKNAKWSTLLKWCEKVRDDAEKHSKKLLTVTCLANEMSRHFKDDPVRAQKARLRVEAIYADEAKRETAINQELIRKANEKKEEKENPAVKKEKKSDRAKRIEAALSMDWQTLADIQEKSGEKAVKPHLEGMVKSKRAFKKRFRNKKTGKVRVKYAAAEINAKKSK